MDVITLYYRSCAQRTLVYGCARCSDGAGWRIQGNWSTPLPDRPTSPKLLTSLLQLACGRDRPAQRHFYHSDISLFGSVHTGCVAARRAAPRGVASGVNEPLQMQITKVYFLYFSRLQHCTKTQSIKCQCSQRENLHTPFA